MPKDSNNGKAKYFCENCGAEVAANARFCPRCGKFFSSVRCPHCGHTGSVQDFKNGCPRCHYAMTDEDIYGEDLPQGILSNDKKSSRKSRKNLRSAIDNHNKRNIFYSEDVPVWLYVVSLTVLALFVALIFFRCQ